MHEPAPRVGLCVTCLVDQILPEIGVATVRLLEQSGFEVDFPIQQTCCGQPFFNSGFRPEAIRLAKRTIEIFEAYTAVVVPSGSCTTMIRTEYPHLLKDFPPWHERAIALADRTYELSEFLVRSDRWQGAPAANGPRVTYHDSCHMFRALGLRSQPRELLARAGCQLAEMKESDRCCGFGGLFSIRLSNVSNSMTDEKLSQAMQTDADVLVTADPGCLMQMRGMVEGHDLRVEHLATVLEAALGDS